MEVTGHGKGWLAAGAPLRNVRAGGQYLVMACRFEIEPRPLSVGGGWRLRLLQDEGTGETEMGGGIFPIEENVTSDDAYADALETGESWLSSVSS